MVSGSSVRFRWWAMATCKLLLKQMLRCLAYAAYVTRNGKSIANQLEILRNIADQSLQGKVYRSGELRPEPIAT